MDDFPTRPVRVVFNLVFAVVALVPWVMVGGICEGLGDTNHLTELQTLLLFVGACVLVNVLYTLAYAIVPRIMVRFAGSDWRDVAQILLIAGTFVTGAIGGFLAGHEIANLEYSIRG